MIYLDHAATTPLAPEVLEAMLPLLRENFGNPAGLHDVSRRASQALEGARREAANLLGAQAPEQIIFTSGGTEGNNLAIAGHAPPGCHVIVGAIEHKSALTPALQLRARGCEVDVLACDDQGRYSLSDFERLMRDETALVVLGVANTELGTVQDMEPFLAAKRGAHLHCDAVGAIGKVCLPEPDSLSLSAHKFYGPKGAGLLYLRNPEHCQSQQWGGGQEGGLRAGTPDVAGAVGLVCALGLSERLRAGEVPRLKALTEALWDTLQQVSPGLLRLGARNLPGLLSVAVPRRNGESLALAMSLRGVAVSTGSACSTLHSGPSHVLEAIGLTSGTIHGHVRFSLGRSTRDEDIAAAGLAFRQALELVDVL